MEKIILIRGINTSEVNEHLEKGWKVKMMKTVNDAVNGRFYAYGVLEKEDE